MAGERLPSGGVPQLRPHGAELIVPELEQIEGWPGFELSWTLARRFWARGYATEGTRAALAHAFTVLRKDRVVSLIHPENRAFIRLAERLGQSLQGQAEILGKEHLVYGVDRGRVCRPNPLPCRWDAGPLP